MNLLVSGKFKLHSGAESNFKIDCDALTDEDLATIAMLISEKIKFSDVYGIPRGGIRLANCLARHRTSNSCLLIVDDVLTTGNSMEETKRKLGRLDTLGVVIFARSRCPDWIRPVFQVWS